jgi:hypothetical protein
LLRKFFESIEGFFFQNFKGLILRKAGVDHTETIRLLNGKIQIALTQTAVESDVLTLESILAFFLPVCRGGEPYAGAAKTFLRVDIQNKGQIRTKRAQNQSVQDLDGAVGQAAPVTLVNAGGVCKAIAQDNFPRLQCRPDQRIYMDCTGCEEHQGLRHGPPFARISAHQKVADLLGLRRPAGLARRNDLVLEGTETFGEKTDLRRLSGTFPALKGDEQAAMGRRVFSHGLQGTPAAGETFAGAETSRSVPKKRKPAFCHAARKKPEAGTSFAATNAHS